MTLDEVRDLQVKEKELFTEAPENDAINFFSTIIPQKSYFMTVEVIKYAL
mgnify:CR=1 FL=1